MKKYDASMTYTAEENLRAERVLDRTFGLTRTAILVFVGLFLSLYGGVLKRGITGYLALGLGVFLLLMPVLRARQSRKNITSVMRDTSVKVTYSFLPDGYEFSSGGETVRGKYEGLFRLLEDERFLYLCLNRSRLLMVDKKSVVPDGADALKAYLSERTGLSWHAPGFELPGKEAVLPRK